jgi:hypothetical protein
MQEDLAGLSTKISAALSVRPAVFITHPAELKILSRLSEHELNQFATEHSWRVVSRVGGRQIEFYNDASVCYRPL